MTHIKEKTMDAELRHFTKLTVEDENGEYTIRIPKTQMFLSEYLNELIVPILKVVGFQGGSLRHYMNTDQITDDSRDPAGAALSTLHDKEVQRRAKEKGQITTIIEMGTDAVTIYPVDGGFEVSVFGYGISKVSPDEQKANGLAEELRERLDRFGWDYVNVHGFDGEE